MSTTTLTNRLPKTLRNELKLDHMYDACFTNEKRTTVTDSHASMVPAGIEKMIEKRQQRISTVLCSEVAPNPDCLRVLCEIEVLRLTLAQLKKESDEA